MRVSELWIYPIKSCRGIPVDRFTLDDRGPENDRRWMLVDAHDRFLSQRELPRLALIDVALDGEQVRVAAPGMPSFSFDRDQAGASSPCTIWRDTVELRHVSPDADRWFSKVLATDCRLVRMPATAQRVVNPDYSPARRLVTLADGFPMLLIGTGSLELLNGKLAARGEPTIPMTRFRPNIVVSGTRPHEEDDWQNIRMGDVDCAVVKPCARCVTTTVDGDTGRAGVEPLRTLASYRKQGSKVFFGQNVIHQTGGTLRRNDDVLIRGVQ